MVAMNMGAKMPGDRHCGRINTIELKLKIEMRLGRQKTEQYFNLLNRYFSLKISKSDFDKLCIGLLGKESVTLHNALIWAIIRNTHISKFPPKNGNGRALSNLKVLPHKGRNPTLWDHWTKNRSSPIRAPFGVSFNAKVRKKSVLDVDTCYYNGELPDRNSLSKRLERRLEMEGLNVSKDCVDLLNNALDLYVKRLLRSCLDVASSRSVKNFKKLFSVSMMDFRVAMELDHRILGGNWPLQMEKMSLFGSEEYMDG